MNRVDDFFELRLRVFRAHQLKYRVCLLNAILRDQPARAGRNAEEHHQKEDGRQHRHPELPAPFCRSKPHPRDAIVGKISQQNADDHIDLKEANQSASQLRRSQLRYVNRPQHRRSANTKSSDEARRKKRVPIPRKRTSQRRQNIKHGKDAQRLASSPFLPRNPRGHCAGDRADQRHGNGEAQLTGAQPVYSRKRMCGPCDDRGVESKQQPAQRANDGSFFQWSVQFVLLSPLESVTAGIWDLILAFTIPPQMRGTSAPVPTAAELFRCPSGKPCMRQKVFPRLEYRASTLQRRE